MSKREWISKLEYGSDVALIIGGLALSASGGIEGDICRIIAGFCMNYSGTSRLSSRLKAHENYENKALKELKK